MGAIKVTFTLDQSTINRLQDAASRLVLHVQPRRFEAQLRKGSGFCCLSSFCTSGGEAQELAIAATAMIRDAGLWTLNAADFSDIRGLRLVALESVGRARPRKGRSAADDPSGELAHSAPRQQHIDVRRAMRQLRVCMSKIAFLFPGQGSQAAGMGKALADSYPSARNVFDQADAALGFPISKLCFEGPDDQLRLTENTQPALLTVSIAAWTVLHEMGYRPVFVAGHSLGEYSALVAAGSLAFTDAVRIVRNRGRYMQDAVPAGVGAMAAILKPPLAELERILAEAAQGEVVQAANFNSPDQMVIAGHAGAVARASEKLKAAGAKRAVPLPVSAPFHCDLMKPAQERLAVDLNAAQFKDLLVPLVNNFAARLVTAGAEAREGLYQQVPNSVRWTDTMRLLEAEGVKRAVEIGAGKVLCGLARQIVPSIQTANFGATDDLDAVRTLLA